MGNKRGLFIVFEGIDGSGKETQMLELSRHIRERNKYQDVIITHEPWKSEEIKRKLQEDMDAYSDGFKMAGLYVKDRANHSVEIESRLNQGYFVLCDRYKMSTCAYQWTQGVNLDKLLEMHQNPEIITPDLTLFIDIPAEVAIERMSKRIDKKEKFEYLTFQGQLVNSYHNLIKRADSKNLFGEVMQVDGVGHIDGIANRIKKGFEPVYSAWKNQNS